MKLVKLHTSSNEEVLVDFEHRLWIKLAARDDNLTIISDLCNTENSFFVRETPEEIEVLIRTEDIAIREIAIRNLINNISCDCCEWKSKCKEDSGLSCFDGIISKAKKQYLGQANLCNSNINGDNK